MQRGTRYIGGRCYVLFNAMDWFGPGTESDEALEREAAAARAPGRYLYVRVIKEPRRCRAFIYVL